MFKIDSSSNRISRIQSKSFTELGFKEREHLQEWLANEPNALGEELLIIQKEFDGFDDTRERLDLLALDKDGNLVVIENKLDDSGRDVLWQALKYASYCSSLTKQQIIDIYQQYLTRYCGGIDAKANLCEFFNISDLEELVLNSGNAQRLVFVAANYRKEVTSTALWLLSHNIQLQCFKVTPYAMSDDLFLNVEQIIPTPEAKEFMIGINVKEAEETQTKTEISSRHKIRPEFWARLLDVLRSSDCNIFNNISPSKDNWISTTAGVSGCGYFLIFNKKEIRLELVFQLSSAERNKQFFDQLKANEDAINNAFGQPLTWLRQENVKQSKIVFVKECDAYDVDNWPELIEWFVTYTIKFESAFKLHLPKVNQQLKNIQ
ncbi:MAG TPA: hypothetical protein DEO86_12115 [Colwellia sp.]|nr:hypothetical protein [Colwellia sp.]